jgi:predicted RNase H-like HicB family nuclease
VLEYHAAYHRQSDSGWYVVTVLDFPGTMSQGRTLRSARRMIRDALRLMAECLMERGEPLPQPDPKAADSTAELVEPIRCQIN